jgi:hypothetical protein
MHPHLKNPLAALEAWFVRRTASLAHPRAPMRACLIVPILFGLLSVWMGQDSNWDLQNYHWYNPYALLHGRLQADMAPGQFQSYFNPTIDLPYYLLNSLLPGPLVGFIMGTLHGLNFVLLAAIAAQVLASQDPDRARNTRLALLLALVGVCGVGFLSELGNTMGDNLTSLLVLGSLYLVLRGWRQLAAFSNRTSGLLLLSGLLMGIGAGLKLTNVTYAAAACLALLAAPLPLPLMRRLGIAFVYGCGVLAGLLASSGYWWWTMWQGFGNPLFPQFNQVFRSPLAQPLGVLDIAHLPHGALEALVWPFVFITDFKRVGEIALRPAIMPVLYVAALVFVCVWLAERFGDKRASAAESAAAPARLSPQARFLLVFGLLAYLGWMKLFSIYRYLVPLELLAPLMLWLLVGRIAARPGADAHAGRIGGWLLALTTLLALPVMTWGHAGWGDAAFSARFPAFEHPESTIVFSAHGDPPMGWLAALAPPGVRVIALAGMPASPAWNARIQAAIAGRPGPHYVMVASAKNEKEGGLQRKLAVANALGLTADAASCARLDRLLHRVRFQVQVKFAPQANRACTLELQPQYRIDLAPRDAAILQTAQDNLSAYGLQADPAACRQYPAAIGAEAFPFRLCPVSRK